MKKIKFAFFGSSRFSTLVLDEIERAAFIPAGVITAPDKPKGRKLLLTPTPVKEWARKRNIRVLNSAKLDADFIKTLSADGWDLFIVASYGKIIPRTVIDIPKYGILNIHPSLLPKYRGASPLQSAMLDDAKHTGITIVKIDEEMDHGPIVAREEVVVNEWPIYEDFEKMMARKGGALLAKILPDWISGRIAEREQNHSSATYTKKITKEDGLLDLNGDSYQNFRKIQAFHEWPRAYFIHERNGEKIRVKVTQASFKDGNLIVEKVIPEGGKKISYEDFSRGYKGV
jgi:methionyl-tRNA formyltransferase